MIRSSRKRYLCQELTRGANNRSETVCKTDGHDSKCDIPMEVPKTNFINLRLSATVVALSETRAPQLLYNGLQNKGACTHLPDVKK